MDKGFGMWVTRLGVVLWSNSTIGYSQCLSCLSELGIEHIFFILGISLINNNNSEKAQSKRLSDYVKHF